MLNRFLSFSGAEALSKGLNWITIASLPLILEPDQYGVVGLLVAMEGIVGNVSLLGQEKSIFKFHSSKDFEVLGYSIRIVVAISVVTFIIAGVIALFLDSIFRVSVFPGLFLVLLSVGFHNLSRLLMAHSRIEENMKMFWGTRLVYQMLKSIFVLALVVYSGTGMSYIYASAFAGFLFVIFYSSTLVPALTQRINWIPDRNYLSIASFGAPMVLHAMGGNILSYADRFFLERYLSLESLGVYTFVYSLGSSIFFFYGAMSSYFEPLTYRCQNSVIHYRSVLRFYLSFVLFLGGLMAVALDLLFDPFIVMLVGPEYAFGSFSFRLILAAHLLIPIYTVANYELAVNGRTKTIGATTLIAAAIYMPLNGYLVPVFGIEGAAIATFVTYFLLAVVTNLLVQLSGGVCWRYLGFVGSCLGLMGVLMAVQYWSEGNVLLRICLSSFVFMILVVMLGKQYMGFKAAIS